MSLIASLSGPVSIALDHAAKPTDVRGIRRHDQLVRRECIEFGAQQHQQRIAERRFILVRAALAVRHAVDNQQPDLAAGAKRLVDQRSGERELQNIFSNAFANGPGVAAVSREALPPAAAPAAPTRLAAPAAPAASQSSSSCCPARAAARRAARIPPASPTPPAPRHRLTPRPTPAVRRQPPRRITAPSTSFCSCCNNRLPALVTTKAGEANNMAAALVVNYQS